MTSLIHPNRLGHPQAALEAQTSERAFPQHTAASHPSVSLTKPACIFIGTTLEDNPVADHFLALSQALVERGHRVVLLTPHRKVALENHASNPAIYTWPSERPTRWRDGRFLRQLVRERRPDSFIANFAAVNLMSLVGWLEGLPCRAAWYHTVAQQIAQDNRYPRWKRELLRLRKRLVYQAATHVVANSQASLEDVHRAFGVPRHKCRVFYNALADPWPHLPPSDGPTPADRLVCVGRFFPSKGQDVLLRALTLLKETHPSVGLELIGGGPGRAACEQLAQELGVADRCVFSGVLPHEQVLQRMRAAVATVVPSRSEAFGLVNIEAMAVGTPVVGSAVGGIVEIVRHGVDGFLVPPDDPVRLAERLGEILGHPALRAQMSASARERFLAKFEQQRALIEQVCWLEEILGRGV